MSNSNPTINSQPPIEQSKLMSQLNELDFSASNKQLELLKRVIFETAETNHAKIQFIKEEFFADKYQINSENIAGKLLERVFITENEVEMI